MLKRFNLLVLTNDKNVNLLMKTASNFDLNCKYKIGIYGDVKQHELYVEGRLQNFKRFIDELEPGMYERWF